MLQKGSKDYKKAQKLANKIFDWANTYKGSSAYDYAEMDIEEVLDAAIEKCQGFGVEVAKTVKKTMSVFTNIVARCSSKQAWIIACTLVEQGIEMSF